MPVHLSLTQFRRYDTPDRMDDLLNDSHDAHDVTDGVDHDAIYEEQTDLTDELEDEIENLRSSEGGMLQNTHVYKN